MWNVAGDGWLKVIDYLDCDHIKCSCINPTTFQAEVEKLIYQIRALKAKPVTPYLHTLHAHVSTMLENYKSLKKFNTSTLELKNTLQTLQQFRG